MAIKATEVGKVLNYSTGFDMSSFTDLELKFTSPTNVKKSFTNSSGTRVTAPSVLVSDPVLGDIAADTYMQLTTLATDFTEDGIYNVCGIYTDGTQVFHGDDAALTIGEACD